MSRSCDSTQGGSNPQSPQRRLHDGGRLVVLGTLLWDRILDQDAGAGAVEAWGGISYSLEALSASLPPGWVVRPLMKIGEDRVEEARAYLSSIPCLEPGFALRAVASPSTRVELRYRGGVRHWERLTGPMPPWTWEEIEGALEGADAVYLNFITGLEMDLEVARLLGNRLSVPLYADLHSLFLDISSQGLRSPRPLVPWKRWFQAFDAIQMNESEFSLLAGPGEDPWEVVPSAMGAPLKLLAVTLGPEGAVCLAATGLDPDPARWRSGDSPSFEGGKPVRVLVPRGGGPTSGDTTGCGDVWGATFFARLLAGDDLERAMTRANELASRKLEHLGAPGLRLHLAQDRRSRSPQDESRGPTTIS